MSFQSFDALKLLILICAPLPHTDNVKESFYGKRFATKDLLLANMTENLNRYIKVITPYPYKKLNLGICQS